MHGSHVFNDSISDKDIVIGGKVVTFQESGLQTTRYSTQYRTKPVICKKKQSCFHHPSSTSSIQWLTRDRSLGAQVIRHWAGVSYLHDCISAPPSLGNLPASYPSFTLGRKAPTSPSEGHSKGMAMFLNRKERLSDDAPADDDSKLESGDLCSTPYSDLLGIVLCL